MTYIYHIKCSGNNKGYIGSSMDIKNRMWAHFGDMKGNKHHSKYMQHSYNKYGKATFTTEILASCPDEYRNKLEKWFIQKSNLNTDFNSKSNMDVRYGFKAKNRSLSNKQLNTVVELLNQGLSCKEIQRRTEIKYWTIWTIKSKKAYVIDSNIPDRVSNKIYQSALEESDILEIIYLLNKETSVKEIAKRFDIGEGTISHIKTGRSFEKYSHLLSVQVKSSRKLTTKDVQDIASLFKEGEQDCQIAIKYNVNSCTINDIRVGKTWNKVTGFKKWIKTRDKKSTSIYAENLFNGKTVFYSSLKKAAKETNVSETTIKNMIEGKQVKQNIFRFYLNK